MPAGTDADVTDAPVAGGPGRFAAMVAAGFFALGVVRVLLHEPWRDEWYIWQLARDSGSLLELRANMRYDGQPGLWYLIVYLITRLTGDVRAMQVVHVAIATLTAWIIARWSPWRRGEILLVLGGYYLLFEYTIIARMYGLGVACLLGAAACIHLRGVRSGWFWLLLLLATQSNACALVLAIALGGGKLVLILRDRPRKAPEALWALLLVAGVVLAWAQSRPGPAPTYAGHYSQAPAELRAQQAISSVWTGLVPLPAPQRAWWNSNLVVTPLRQDSGKGPVELEPEGTFLMSLALLGLLAILVRAFWRDPAALTIFLLAVTGMLLFIFALIPGANRHHGHYAIAMLLASWVCASRGRAAPSGSIERLGYLAILWAQLAAGVIASIAGVVLTFSASRAAADYIRAAQPDLPLIAQEDYAAGPVAAILGREFFSPRNEAWVRLCSLSENRISETFWMSAAAQAMLEFGRGQRFLLVLSAPGERYMATPEMDVPVGNRLVTLRLTRLAEFTDSTIADERYTIYEVSVAD